MDLRKSFHRNGTVKAFFCLLLIVLSSATFVHATHNRAGEIIYERIGQDRFKITIITFTEINNSNADRDTLELLFGDGTKEKVRRTTKQPDYKGYIDFQRNTYVTEHTFPGPGGYMMSVLDPNRNGGVINIPNSIERKFYIESFLNITLGASNNSVILTRDPIAFACAGVPFYHNPGAFDPDGDSLVYSLVPCKADFGIPIPDYKFPSATKTFEIDKHTGILTWDSPITYGEYNVAILVTEYRKVVTANGTKKTKIVGSILRDMQITVFDQCTNKPPEISPVSNYCILAGSTLDFDVFASDTHDGFSPHNGTQVFLEAFGGPLEIDPVAEFITSGIDPVTGNFHWETACSHVKKNPYNMTFEARDNGTPELSNFQVSQILVVAPPVENVTADAFSSSINLTWEKQKCSQAIGYKIFRHAGSTGFVPDSCETGVPGYLGYELIYESSDVNELQYTDDNLGKGLIPGVIYCYLIVAHFADGAESYASEEVCAKLKKDVPILTNVDVLSTSASDGEIYLAWSKPDEHNTTEFPGPYEYKIYRTEKRKFEDFEIVGGTVGINDTTFTDVALNTLDVEYTYKIEMYDLSGAPRSMGFSVLGTSIYLRTVPKDNLLVLHWNELVPWNNKVYTVFKQNESGGFDTLINTKGQTYTDTNLKNNKEYCYKVTSEGSYSLQSIAKPLFNTSQIHCNKPIDLQAPCAPVLDLFADDCENVKDILTQNGENCNALLDGINEVEKVELTWTNPNLNCDTTDDVTSMKLFYSPVSNGSYKLIYEVFIDTSLDLSQQPQEFEFIHLNNNTRAGCYYVVALDQGENENNEPNVSPPSDTVCIDNCLLYELPNVFTPNNDGFNDLFEPFPYCYVEEVEMRIFNRWGSLVFETTDADIKWDGMNIFSKEKAPDGIYYYTCIVHQITLEGIKELELKGVVHILGTSNSQNN